MPPRSDSRFAGLPTLSVRAPDGSSRRVVALRLRRPRLPLSVVHRVARHEEVDSIARRYWGDEGLWWRVLDANRLLFPLDLETGDPLDIPEAESATRAVRSRGF